MNDDITAEQARNMLEPYSWDTIMSEIKSAARVGQTRVGGLLQKRWLHSHTERLVSLGYRVRMVDGYWCIYWNE